LLFYFLFSLEQWQLCKYPRLIKKEIDFSEGRTSGATVGWPYQENGLNFFMILRCRKDIESLPFEDEQVRKKEGSSYVIHELCGLVCDLGMKNI